MDDFISLPHARIHKKEPTKKLNILPTNYFESFCKNWLDGIDFSKDTDFQQSIVNKTSSEDVFGRKPYAISKNVIRNQNPIELLFKDSKHFDAQNLRLVS